MYELITKRWCSVLGYKNYSVIFGVYSFFCACSPIPRPDYDPWITLAAKYAHFIFGGAEYHVSLSVVNTRFRFHSVFPSVIQADVLINSLQ